VLGKKTKNYSVLRMTPQNTVRWQKKRATILSTKAAAF
jgi:hypothetical protein